MTEVVSALTAGEDSVLAHSSVTPASQPAYSFLSVASKPRMNCSRSASFPAGTAMTASQREQITLSNLPPCIAARRRPGSCSIAE